MNVRLIDLQDQLTEMQNKHSTAEKSKQKLQNQIAVLLADADTVIIYHLYKHKIREKFI